MLSPSPTQPPPVLPTPEAPPQQKPVIQSTPAQKRLGETRGALLTKRILRPVFKFLYYCIQGIRRYKLFAFLGLILVVASIFATSYFATGQSTAANNSAAIQNGNGTKVTIPQSVQNWLMALQKGDIDTMLTIQKDLLAANKPDVATAVIRFSTTQGTRWTGVKFVGFSQGAQDGTNDYFIEVDMTLQTATGATQNAVVLWHFTTVTLPAPRGEVLYAIDYVSERPLFK